jgi:hypothetical protein
MKQDDSGDPRVSAAYQQMADERTPEHLDHVILNAARGAARPRWNKAIAWLRPAAWVATIGVCLVRQAAAGVSTGGSTNRGHDAPRKDTHAGH